MSWTDERVELLKKMWEEGSSASQIATQLGGVSRNAVIGKVHRLKISRLEKAPPAEAKNEKAPLEQAKADEPPVTVAFVSDKADKLPKSEAKKNQSKSSTVVLMNEEKNASAPLKGESSVTAKAATKKQEPQSAPQESSQKEENAAQKMAANEEADDGVVVPISRRLSLLQLTEHTCKWPIGDPLGAGFHFCGAKTCEGGPYCSYHSKIAFQPVAERRRVRV